MKKNKKIIGLIIIILMLTLAPISFANNDIGIEMPKSIIIIGKSKRTITCDECYGTGIKARIWSIVIYNQMYKM